MSKAAKIAKTIRGHPDNVSDPIDLAGFNSVQVDALVKEAFGTPMPYEKPVRVTFVVGAGKGGRQKYPASLRKDLCTALREVAGYEEDSGAFCGVKCQGAFKYQHDTGQNLMYIHTFPRLTESAGGGAGAGGADGGGEAALDVNEMSSSFLLAVASIGTFRQMVAAQVQTWSQKKAAEAALREVGEDLTRIVNKMVRMEPLTTEEQTLFDSSDAEVVREKVELLQEMRKAMVADGQLTGAELRMLADQVTSKLDKVTAALAELEAGAAEGSKKAAKKLAALTKQKEKLTERRAHFAEMSPVFFPLRQEKALRQVWDRLLPLELGLTDDLSAKAAGPQLEEQLEELLDRSRTWFEEDDAFDVRVAALKADCVRQVKRKASRRGRGGGGGGGGGWSTAGKKKGKKRR